MSGRSVTDHLDHWDTDSNAEAWGGSGGKKPVSRGRSRRSSETDLVAGRGGGEAPGFRVTAVSAQDISSSVSPGKSVAAPLCSAVGPGWSSYQCSLESQRPGKRCSLISSFWMCS